MSNNIHFTNPVYDVVTTSVYDCKITELDKNHRDKGNITVVENGNEVPFDINRVYYLYDVPGGEERGGHAHKELYQILISAGGSFDVVLDDVSEKRTVHLNRPYQGLKIVPGIWRELINFSSGATCLVLASHGYDEGDYIRNYEEFENLKNAKEVFESYLHGVFGGSTGSPTKGDGWEEKRFDEVCVLQRGFDLPTHSRFEGEYPLVSSNGIIGYHDQYTTSPPGITIGRSGNIGKPFIININSQPKP